MRLNWEKDETGRGDDIGKNTIKRVTFKGKGDGGGCIRKGMRLGGGCYSEGYEKKNDIGKGMRKGGGENSEGRV
jgi:hypothetical protein